MPLDMRPSEEIDVANRAPTEPPKSPTVRDVIVRAREIIADKKHWCRGIWAKDVAGNQVSVYSAEAHSFCAIGAISRASIELGESLGVGDLIRDATHELNKPSQTSFHISHVNDNKGHAAVLALFDRWIAENPPQD